MFPFLWSRARKNEGKARGDRIRLLWPGGVNLVPVFADGMAGASVPLLLAAAHVEGARSLFSLFDLKLHPLPFSQTIEIKVLQARAMEKYLLAFGAADEAKPAVPNDPFDRTLHVSLDSRQRSTLWTGSKETRQHENEPLLRDVRTVPAPQLSVKARAPTRLRVQPGIPRSLGATSVSWLPALSRLAFKRALRRLQVVIDLENR